MSDARVYQGAERRSRRLPLKYALLALLGASAIAYATLCPIELRPHVAPANEERLLAFVALGFVLALTFRRRWAQVTVGVMLFAVGLEAVQHFIPGRHGQIDDAIANQFELLHRIAAQGAAGIQTDSGHTAQGRIDFLDPWGQQIPVQRARWRREGGEFKFRRLRGTGSGQK